MCSLAFMVTKEGSAGSMRGSGRHGVCVGVGAKRRCETKGRPGKGSRAWNNLGRGMQGGGESAGTPGAKICMMCKK